MKSIGYGLAAVFSWAILINDANAEAWGNFEPDSFLIKEKDTQNIAVISDNLFDEVTKDDLASVKEIKNSKNIKSKKTSNKSKTKSRKKSKKKR